jgi:hypothetical protein
MSLMQQAGSPILSASIGDREIYRKKPQVRMEGWKIVPGLMGGYRLWGAEIIGHPELGEGVGPVFTSELLRIDLVDGVAETRNTFYLLGTPLSLS